MSNSANDAGRQSICEAVALLPFNKEHLMSRWILNARNVQLRAAKVS